MASNDVCLHLPEVCIEEVFEREIEKQCALVEDENIRDALSLMLNLVKQVRRSTIKRSEEHDSRHMRLLSSLGHVPSQEERFKMQRPSTCRPPSGGRLLTAKEGVDAALGAGHATVSTLPHMLELAATQEEATERHSFRPSTEPAIAPVPEHTRPLESEASSDDAPLVAAKISQAARPLADCADVMPKKAAAREADGPLPAPTLKMNRPQSLEMRRQQSLCRASADPQDAVASAGTTAHLIDGAASVPTTARSIDGAAPAQGQRPYAGRVDSASSFGRLSSRNLPAWSPAVSKSTGVHTSHSSTECGQTPDTQVWRGIWQEQFDGMRNKTNFGKAVPVRV